MYTLSRFIAFFLLFSFYASQLEAKVEGGVSGNAAIGEDSCSNDGPTATAWAGKVRRTKKKAKQCASKTKYLTSADEICGQILDAPGWKYVISVPGKKKVVDCGVSNGPTVTGNAILDCSQATIRGTNPDPYSSNYGITVGGSAVVQNCAVSHFTGYGVVLDKTPGDKNVFNTQAHGNAANGFFIEKEVNTTNDNKLVNIESNNNGFAGIYIEGGGDNTIVSPKVKGNGYNGIDIRSSGTNTLVSIESNNNGLDGVRIQGNGDNTILSPKVHANGYSGINIAGSGTNKLTDVDIELNQYAGININGGIVEIHEGVINKNSRSGVINWGGTTRIKDVVIKRHNYYGVYLYSSAGHTYIEGGSLISKNLLGGVRIKSSTFTKSSCSSIQSNDGGFGVQIDADYAVIMDTDIANNSVNNIHQKDAGAANAIMFRVRACNGFTDDVADFNVTELTSTTCDSTDCGYTCNECQHVVKTCTT
jgi:parallel beta-helix repeat protein